MSEQETSAVGLAEVRRFLERSGWRRTPSGKSSLDVYSSGDGVRRIEILLPSEGVSKNPARWINAAMRTLSQLRGVSELDLADVISAFSFDRVRSRLPDALVRDDTIRLTVAAGMLRGIRKLFESAATTESNPRPYFPRVLKTARSYIDECRFGHTFRGSFGFVVESPVREQQGNPELIPGISPIPAFERRVVERVVRGLTLIPAARRANAKSTVVENFGSGFSANMCEAIIELVDVTRGAGLEFSFELSPSVNSALNQATLEPIALDVADAEFLSGVVATMREKRVVRYSEFSGRVVALKTRSIPGDMNDLQDARQIVVEADTPSTGKIEIHISLQPEDYLAALASHAEGRSLRLAGNLEQISRTWFLLEPKLQQERSLFETQQISIVAQSRAALPPPKTK
jgi:hypothetical protein